MKDEAEYKGDSEAVGLGARPCRDAEGVILIDADVLGRQRTGDETYVQNLLRRLPALAPDLRFGAITRHPELVPEGVEAIELPARSQEVRMAWHVPRLLRRLRPALSHFQHALPPRAGAAVLTVHDLSFEREPTAMGRADRAIFKLTVPRSVRRARHVIAVSERTKRDLIELYGVPEEKITVTPHGVDPAFGPGEPGPRDYLLYVGAIQARKDPLAAAEAAREVGLPLIAVGPEREPTLARELEARGVDVRGHVEKAELAGLYRGAAALVLPSRYEGFGLPVLEAMASGTPVVVSNDPAMREVAGDAAVFADDDLPRAIREALADSDRLRAAGLQRAKQFSWDESARLTVEVYRKVLA